jgi:hypothetical protein
MTIKIQMMANETMVILKLRRVPTWITVKKVLEKDDELVMPFLQKLKF